MDLRSVLEGPIDLLAVDGTCVTPVGVDLLHRRHGERVCVAHSREEARFAIQDLEESEVMF
jgi:transcription elongation GreA/GreB family factor